MRKRLIVLVFAVMAALAVPAVGLAEQPHHGCDDRTATCFHKDTGQHKTGQHPSKHHGNN